jgi:hypothetical protein
MNRPRITSIILAAAAAVSLAAPGATLASSGPARFPADNQPADFGAGQLCAFPVHVGIVLDHETISMWFDADNNPSHLLITGALVLAISNADSGRTIDVNVPGPVQIDLAPDGSSTWTFYGPSMIGGMPAPLPGGGLYLNDGPVVMSDSAANEVTVLAQHGHATDLCEPLA